MRNLSLRPSLCLSSGRLLPLLLVMLLWCVSSAIAQESDAALEQAIVEFTGEIIGEADGSFTVRGDVRFLYEDTEIESQYLVVEPGGNVIHFYDQVVVRIDDYEMRGERFVYNVPERTSILFRARGELELESVEGPVYYSAERMEVEDERVILTGARFTTCKCEPPGYYLAGTSMEIIPDVSLTIYNVRFVESGITFFYWPRLTIPLTETARPPFELPRIGHTTDGWFVETSWPYKILGTGGFLLLDWYQNRGIGAGVRHYYRDDESGYGLVHLYGLANQKTQSVDPHLEWEGRLSTNHWSASWNLAQKAQGAEGARTSQTSGRVSLQNFRPDGSFSVNGSGTYNRLASGEVRQTLSGNFRINQQLWAGTRLTVTGNTWVRRGYTTTDRQLIGYSVDLNNTRGPITWRIAASERFNPDLTKDEPSGPITWRSSGSRPEITVGARPSPRLFGRSIPLTLEASWGRYTEQRFGNEVRDTRGTALVQLRTMTFPLNSRFSLNAAGYVRGTVYGSGGRRLILSSTYGATYRPIANLQLRATYEYLEEFGSTPFAFDRVSPRERILGSMNYSAQKMNLSVSSGFSLLTFEPEDVRVTLQARPLEHVSLRVQGGYSLKDMAPLTTVGSVEIGGDERFSLKLGGQYSRIVGAINRVDGALQVDLGGWRLGYQASYNPLDGTFGKGIFTLLRDLDCRLIGFSYDHREGEIWFEYRITAIPTMGLRFGSDEGSLLFDLEGWEELLNWSDE